MKFSLLKNDKSTCMDEVILSITMLVILVIGIVVMIKAPAFWLIDAVTSRVFGFALTFMGVLFIPGLIQRWLSNDKK